jgi:hypothetical protein
MSSKMATTRWSHRLSGLWIVATAIGLAVTAETGREGGERAPWQADSSALPGLLDFDAFRLEFDKHYDTPEELASRKAIFEANYREALESRAAFEAGLRDTYLSTNERSDLAHDQLGQLPAADESPAVASAQEAGQLDGGWKAKLRDAFKKTKKGSGSTSARPEVEDEDIQLPPVSGSNSDDDDDDTTVVSLPSASLCLNPIREQGDCGSCYAITALTVIEYSYCLEERERIQFSVQEIVDCSWMYGNSGCLGGRLDYTFQFAHELGLVLERDYLYTGAEGNCKIGPTLKTTHRLDDQRTVRVNQEDWPAWIANDFPLVVVLSLPPGTLDRYAGGIDNPAYFDKPSQHSAVLVAIRAQGDTEYYVLRDSCGQSWGQNGHYHINVNSPAIHPVAYRPQGKVELTHF